MLTTIEVFVFKNNVRLFISENPVNKF